MSDKILLTRPLLPDFNDFISEISSIWDTRWLTNMGEKHEAFELALNQYLHTSHISLFCNGHLALELCLQAFDLSGEVITTPFTFVSTTHAIARNNLVPVFCDIDPKDFTIDVSKIESLITAKTSAIVPVHVYGNICNVEEIERIARKYHLTVIYDAAHAFGELYNGRGIGTYGDASMFSFHATKVFNSIEGGAVATGHTAIIDRLYQLKNFGIMNEETIDYIGGNAKMNEFCAAMGICNLRLVDQAIEERKRVFYRYIEILSDTAGLILPQIQPNVVSNYSYYPILIEPEIFGCSRDALKIKLAENNIFARKYFYPATNAIECYRNDHNGNTPIAADISQKVLTLPIYPGLLEDDIKHICDVIKCEHITNT